MLVSDLIFAAVVYYFAAYFTELYEKKKIPFDPGYIIPVGQLLNTALIVVDNMHFCYNSLLLSFFLASILAVLRVWNLWEFVEAIRFRGWTLCNAAESQANFLICGIVYNSNYRRLPFLFSY